MLAAVIEIYLGIGALITVVIMAWQLATGRPIFPPLEGMVSIVGWPFIFAWVYSKFKSGELQ